MFSANGSYASPRAFTAGLTAALPIAAAVLALGALLALQVPEGRGALARAAPPSLEGTPPRGAPIRPTAAPV